MNSIRVSPSIIPIRSRIERSQHESFSSSQDEDDNSDLPHGIYLFLL